MVSSHLTCSSMPRNCHLHKVQLRIIPAMTCWTKSLGKSTTLSTTWAKPPPRLKSTWMYLRVETVRFPKLHIRLQKPGLTSDGDAMLPSDGNPFGTAVRTPPLESVSMTCRQPTALCSKCPEESWVITSAFLCEVSNSFSASSKAYKGGNITAKSKRKVKPW